MKPEDNRSVRQQVGDEDNIKMDFSRTSDELL
jgi:hypothetical protein